MSVLKLCQGAKVIEDVAETNNLKLSWTSVTSDSTDKKNGHLWPR